MKNLLPVILFLTALLGIKARDIKYHITRWNRQEVATTNPEVESKFWLDKAQDILDAKIKQTQNQNKAKNVIFFMGDGMSVATLTAARTYEMELNGTHSGEGNSLSFEKFPYSGLSKTYCVDYKVADSACSATAYLGGVKGNKGTIGVNGKVLKGDCEAMNNAENHVDSIAKWFQEAGRATGVVTTTRVTHASPAGLYAHTADRSWESDKYIKDDGKDDTTCDDIAEQLVTKNPGNKLKVIMGGGQSMFLPKADGGKRKDEKNLIQEWVKSKEAENVPARFITTRDELLNITEIPDYLLGLFSKSHMDYHLLADAQQPRLFEMTEAAIKVLQKNTEGFYLFVEGGKIDIAHHGTKAHLSLDETVEFAKAVEAAKAMTSSSDTLIVVTADHAHTMTLNGYPLRESSIFSFAGHGTDEIPYTTLSYANGPSYKNPSKNKRYDIGDDKIADNEYLFPSAVPLSQETHGGDDVAVFAEGPWSHLFTGSFEQNYIPHALAYAACVGKGKKSCDANRRKHDNCGMDYVRRLARRSTQKVGIKLTS